MPVQDVVVIEYVGRDCSNGPNFRLAREENPSAFDDYVSLAEGLVVGETKTLRDVDGYLLMHEDRSLTLTRVGIGPEIPPQMQVFQPGDARYEELIAQVGGMAPGERKRVLRPAGQ